MNTVNKVAIRTEEIAVLILSTKNILYDQFKLSITNGWLKKMQSMNVKCYFYSGEQSASSIHGDQINVKTPDSLIHTSEKLLTALDLLMNKHPEVKLVYRTNLSSYIECENFIRFINRKKLDDYTYTGLIGETTYAREFFYGNRFLHKIFSLIPIGERIKFASGSGFFIGSKNISKLLKSPPQFIKLIDDVMVAKTLEMEPSKIIAPLRFDINENGEHKIEKSLYENLVNECMLYHYRFKTSNRSIDAEMLNAFNDPMYRYACCTLA